LLKTKNNFKFIYLEKDKNTLEITTNGENVLTNDISKDDSSLKSNIEDCQLNSLSFVSSVTNDFKQTGELHFLDKISQSSNSTISSMVIMNYNYV